MLAVVNALYPLLRRTHPSQLTAFKPDGEPDQTNVTSRIVNMASLTGKLNDKYSSSVTLDFRRHAMFVEDVNALMRRYLDSLTKGTLKEDGWPINSPYAVSKAGVIALTRAMDLKSGFQPHVLVNCCCPGFVKTDLTKGRGRKTPDKGAATPVMLALDDLNGATGRFWTNGEVIGW